jgi:hypothetical protein
MKAVDVVQVAIIGFGRDRQAPVLTSADIVLHHPLERGIARGAAGCGVGDGDRRLQFACFLDPQGAGHFAIAVERMIAGKARHTCA